MYEEIEAVLDTYVRPLLRAHGGDIYASSDAGLTSFTVWIPQGPSVARS